MHPHDERPYSFCPMCGGGLEPRAIKQNEPERLVCVRCGFVFYLDPKVAVGTIIRDDSDRIDTIVPLCRTCNPEAFEDDDDE